MYVDSFSHYVHVKLCFIWFWYVMQKLWRIKGSKSQRGQHKKNSNLFFKNKLKYHHFLLICMHIGSFEPCQSNKWGKRYEKSYYAGSSVNSSSKITSTIDFELDFSNFSKLKIGKVFGYLLHHFHRWNWQYLLLCGQN